MPSLFLSYRRADSQEVVGRIYDRLKAHFPVERIFRDLESIPLGKPFSEVIREAIAHSQIALIVIGPRWVTITDPNGHRRLEDPTDPVRIEAEVALSSGVLVVPVLVSEATMPAAEELPSSLQPLIVLQAIQIRPDPDFHRDMDRLIGQLSQLIVQSPGAVEGRPTNPTKADSPQTARRYAWIESDQVKDVMVIRIIRQPGNRTDIEELEQELLAAIEKDACRKVVISLAGISYWASITFVPLLKAFRYLRENNRRLRLCDVNPLVHELFRCHRIDRVLEIVDNRETALCDWE
jgi:anti-anti-sigma factor